MEDTQGLEPVYESFSEYCTRIAVGFRKRVASKPTTWSQQFVKSQEWKDLRDRFLASSDKKCVKCGAEDELQVDHIKPKSKYRHLALEWSNLQVLCWTCNRKKSNRE